ncbi:MAG: polysaccharide biosynthesis protein PslH [Acidobacteriota bacterium]|nr:polysaccharide biosynthesis protein PslH [Acidobacteriota bacterium]
MKILVVATKAPWPPLDGGRLLLLHTLEGLAAAGHRVTLVAPVDPGRFDIGSVASALRPLCSPRLVAARPAERLPTLVRAVVTGMPLSVARHSLAAVRGEVERLLATEPFDLVHAEQLQALPQVPRQGTPPVVLRAQNVESALWAAAARRRGGGMGALLAIEARRLAAWEGEAVRRTAATVALTPEDAARLAQLAGFGGLRGPAASGKVHTVAAPFPASLPAGGTALSGDPAVVVLGSAGWLPNADSAAWFRNEVWPAVRAALPGAVLHLFGEEAGGSAVGVTAHPAPADSADAFPARAILAVPVRIASGVRMKILEAWARGVPVVGTPEAVSGLGAESGRELLVAEDPAGFATALARLHGEPALARSLVAAGRAALRERHDPAAVSARLAAIYAEVVRGTP